MLIELIAEVFNDRIIAQPKSFKREIIEGLSKALVEKAKVYSCSSRSILANNDKVLKRVDKLKLASRSDAGLFAKSLLYIRRKYKHRGVQLIGPGSSDWLMVKELTKQATEFCNEFQMHPKVGYVKYLDIALGMMNNFGLNKIKSLHSPICNRYEAILEIEQCKYPDRAREAHDVFMGRIAAKTGGSMDYSKNPDKYRYFVRAADEAKSMGISISDYIESQFEAFDWKSAVPEPSQLYGDKARERAVKYCFQKNIQMGRGSAVVQGPNINFKAIKKHGKKGRHNNK